ncbi:MAG: plastocyanin/azurin family copper-binding protein [Halarchaeum sp.]
MTVDRRRYLGLVAGAAAALAGCSSNGGSGTTTTDGTTANGTTTAGTTTGPATEATVGMYTEESGQQTAFYFDPVGLHVAPGATVTFEVKSGGHSSTSYSPGNPMAETTRIPDGAKPWDSAVLNETGATFEHVFETEGTYDYYCIPHKSLGMVARIVVGSPGGPAEGSMPPDGDVPTSDAILSHGSISHDAFRG